MPAYTTPHNIEYPTASDLIKSSTSESALADDFKALADSAQAALTQEAQKLGTALFYRRDLETGEDVNALTAPGVYGATTTAIAGSLLNGAAPVPGVYIVAGPSSGVRSQIFMPNTGGMLTRSISVANGQFGAWEVLDQRGRVIPDNTDMATFRDLGPFRIASTSSASTILNRPPIPAGPAIVQQMSHNGVNATGRVWYDMTGQGAWMQTLYLTSWEPWQKLGATGGGSSGTDAGAGHLVKSTRETESLGGKIGTGGLGVFVIRIDHNMVGMMTKLQPMLEARSLPASMCHFVNQFNPQPGYTGDDSTGYGWPDVQNLVLLKGIEAMSHGWSHQDAVGTAALEHEIIDSRVEMETQMPKVRLHGFMVPGTSGTFWGGFTNNLADPNIWTKTEAGLMVMGEYASSNGGGGTINPLGTGKTLGWQSVQVDTHTTSASAISYLQQAQDTGTGAVIMIHPSQIDAGTGFITSAVMEEILDYMVAERDAGRAIILTVNGMLNSDPDSSRRPNLLRDPVFANGLARWSGTTGYTVAGGVASGSTSAGLLSQTVDLSSNVFARGSMRELFVEVRATAGAVIRVRASDATTPANWDVSKDVTLPASANWVTVRVPCGIPATGTDSAKFEVGRVSGGAIDLRNPGILAV